MSPKIATLLLLFASSSALAGLRALPVVGCSPAATETRAANVAKEIGYGAALDECLAKGRDAGSRAVYESCAKEADGKYGRDGGF